MLFKFDVIKEIENQLKQHFLANDDLNAILTSLDITLLFYRPAYTEDARFGQAIPFS